MTVFETTMKRIDSYLEDAEQWKKDHDTAARCMNFELLLQHATSVYEAINFFDESARQLHASGKQEYTAETGDVIRKLYRSWLQPHESIVQTILVFENAGYSVSFSSEFRSAVREVQSLLAEDEDMLTTDRFIELRDAAIDDHRAGNCESINGG